MKLLVITREAWADNNTGNTMTSFFKDLSNEIEIHNLFFRESQPLNNIAKTTFRISEKQIINFLIKRKECGEFVNFAENDNDYSKIRANKNTKEFVSYIPYFLREILWMSNCWKCDNFYKYLINLNPDIVFSPVFPCWYTQKILLYIKNVLPNTKIVLFHADDTYSLKQFSVLPSFWIYRLIQRKWVKRIVKKSNLNYVISSLQKQEIDKTFNINSKILTKFYDFSEFRCNESVSLPFNISYTGNLSMNRWKTLSFLSQAINEYNTIYGKTFILNIYSATMLSKRQLRKLCNSYCFFYGKISLEEVIEVQKKSSYLCHVEPFDLKNRLKVRQSFSTKIVDYISSGRPVIAIGPRSVSSIDYFIKNKCGYVCIDKERILGFLSQVKYKTNDYNDAVKKQFEVANRLHEKKILMKMLKQDLENL